MSEELAARLMARIAVPPMPFAPDTYTAGRMDQFTEMITQLRALPEVDKEQVLADAKARIEGALVDLTDRHDDDPYLKGYRIARRDALAALTQPQTEIHINSESEPSDEDKAIVGDLVNRAVDRMKSDGGGAATAADADLELPLTDSTLVEEVVAAVYEACLDRAMDDPDAIEVAAVLRGELTGTRAATEPTPYAKAFRERVCPVPEFPGIEKEES